MRHHPPSPLVTPFGSTIYFIYPSIGYKGHVTPPHIFFEGAEWIKRQFIHNGD